MLSFWASPPAGNQCLPKQTGLPGWLSGSQQGPQVFKDFPRAVQSCSRLPAACASNRQPLSRAAGVPYQGCLTQSCILHHFAWKPGTQMRVKLHKIRVSLGLSLGKSLTGGERDRDLASKIFQSLGDLVLRTFRRFPSPSLFPFS